MLVDPSQYRIPIVRINTQTRKRQFDDLEWGFVRNNNPLGKRVINARAETAFSKWPWKIPIRKQRCLIPADGFYEWHGPRGKKQGYRFTLRGERLFSLAGLWDYWKSPEGKLTETFTVMTISANDLVRPVHAKNRMPVILNPGDYDTWLSLDIDHPPTLAALLRPYPAEDMQVYRVGEAAKNPRFDSPDCVVPVSPDHAHDLF